MSKRTIAAMLLGLAAALTAAGAAPKIDPRVLSRAQSEATVAVFIVLERQPQREILERAESANGLYRQVAESRYRQAAERALTGSEELRQARKAAEAVTLRTRQQAFQAIQQAVGPEQDVMESRLRGLGAMHVSRYPGINTIAAEIPAPAIAALEADPAIAHVFLVEKQYPQLVNSVPTLGAPAFWNAGFTGQGESVGILDSGVRTNHPAFAGVSIISQVFLDNGSTDTCFADDAGSVQDEFGHGTHVAGIVASQGSPGWTNYQGVAKGIGTLYNLKVGYKLRVSSSCDPVGEESDPRDVLAALDWAVANTPLKIFNYSYGSPTTDDDDGFTQSIDQYIDNYGLTITISAGNGGLANYRVTSPGIAYNGITVANAESYDSGLINYTSSSGPTAGGRYKPDLAAPGTNIYSTAYNWDAVAGTSDDFVSMTGTSMAAPHVAGAAALLESAGVTNPLAVKAVLLNTGKFGGGWSNNSGWGYTSLNNARSDLYYATGSLEAGGSQLYKVSGPTGHLATLVWNRHVSGSTSSFNLFNLSAFDAHSGNGFYGGSPQDIQDVEMVSAWNAGDFVLALKMASAPMAGVTSEAYALAATGPLTPVTGPKVSASCSMPNSLLSGSKFQVNCDVTNAGELPAPASNPGVTVWYTLPAGFLSENQITVPEIATGSTYTGIMNVTAPMAPGTYTGVWSVSVPGWYGLAPAGAAGSLTTTVHLALPQPAVLSPANGDTGVSLVTTLTWTAVPGAASYDVYFGTPWDPQLLGTTTQTSYSPSGLVAGTMYCWRVVARNSSGASSSPLVSFTTQAASGGEEWYLITTYAPIFATGVAVDGSLNVYAAQGTSGIGVTKVAPDGTMSSITGTRSGPIAADAAGNVYLAPAYEFIVYKIAPNGTVTTVAGTGVAGQLGDGGPASSAQLTFPAALTLDAAGNLYISDGPAVRKVSLSGIITTVAGDVWGTWGYSGDGGPATSAQVSPGGLAVDASGSLYIADGSSRIRKVTPDGIINTVAGTGTCAFSGDGGPAISAGLCMPKDVKMDAAGNLYIADSGVRKITTDGIIKRIAGGGSGSGDGGPALGVPLSPVGLAVDRTGRVFVADSQGSVRALIPADPSCRYQLDQTALTVPGAGGTVPVSIQTGPGCWWGVAGLPYWITARTSGVGPATINLAVEPSGGPLQVATFAIAGVAVTITQADAPCAYAIISTPQTFPVQGGTDAVILSAPWSCPWTASVPAASWATVVSPLAGAGGAGLSIFVAANPGQVRSTTMTVAGLPVTIRQAGTPSPGLRFVPVPPCRVADTRGGAGAMAAAETRSFAVPQSGCGIPSTAQAYSLNVTVVPKGPLSFLTLWPTGQDKPLVSTLNSFGGIVVANAAIVPAGANGAVNAYVTDPTDVILDIDGYFDSPGNYAFYPVQPCRVADTRNPTGPFGGPELTGAESRDFPVPSSSCGLPSTASAYSMNVTVVPAGYLGYLKTWPTGQTQPNVSTLNSWTGKVVANAALVPAGSGGAISVYAEDATQVVLDTNGYFGAPGGAGGLNFYPVTPCRVADTRGAAGPFGGPEMGDGEVRSFPIPSSGCGIPATAAAYSLNVTVVPDGMLQYLTAWPAGADKPLVSTLNSWDGAVVANAAIVPAGTGGAINVFVANRTQVILDINGYFAP